MAIPQSEKLQAESGIITTIEGPSAYMQAKNPAVLGDEREIKEVFPLNDMVAIWVQSNSGSTIIMSEKDKYKNEGVVVGAGPSTTQVKIGDMVLFPEKAPNHVIDSATGFYAGQRIMLMSEKMLLMKLRAINYTLVEC